ncbi:leucine-rich repeat protein [Agathobaculum sp. NTUH-O15-33]|uniref:leucine-rich repeat protein n=1 Tax=Agathobaculum sp. NTUH-O15-33 TaxID=3079302 RepID=UPI002958A6C1|nr:leucine-rich repeat protein [Agathobaculum sp. NTUH-O15-33]WNX84407.1 leucine-rich repeat protein [Agathobaculum sp. NTUH-O15-33]
MLRTRKRIGALLLAAALVIGQLGATAYAEEPENTGKVTVTAFDGLDEAVKYQTVPAGTPLDGLSLPATLGASVYTVAADTQPVPAHIQIEGVTWEPDSPWDDTAEQGGYTFAPVLPAGYVLTDKVEPPEIYVRIGEPAVPLDAQDKVLTVKFNDNGSGGKSDNDNDMKTAIDAAFTSSGANQANITTIKLTGSVTEITRWNWKYLIDQYNRDSGWDSLTALDLSGMTNLEAIRNDTYFSMGLLTKLTTLTLPDSMTEIGYFAFSYCTGLKLDALPKKLTKIGDYAFYGCTSILLDALPDDVKQIGDSAFNGCTGLKLTALPKKLTKIGDSAFRNCAGITLDALPDDVKQIGAGAFSKCTGLKLTKLPDGVTYIGERAFQYCTGITLKELPDGVTYIESYAFNCCTGITLDALPKGLKQIEEQAFYGCTSLNEIIMESTAAPTLGEDVFGDTNITFYVPKGGTGYDKGGWESLNTVKYSPTTSISLPATLELRPNESGTLTVTPTPNDAVPIFLWESSDTNIATVDKNGSVTAVAVGTATITATSRQGRKTAACTVTVLTPVTGVTLHPSELLLYTNKEPKTAALTATVEPADASNKAVSWKSSDTNIATVDGSGNVTAVSSGTATITATTEDGSYEAACTVTVETVSSGGGGGSSYFSRTLTDKPTGIVVKGTQIHGSAALTVKAGELHGTGDAGCDLLRAAQASGHLPGVWDVSLSRGFRGKLTVSLPVADRNGQTLTVAHCVDGKLTLSGVKVSEGFAKVETDSLSPFAVLDGVYTQAELEALAAPGWKNPFADVKVGDWFYDAVKYVHQKGLMVGVTETAFGPDGPVTRAQVWTVLARLDGADTSGGAPWYAPAQTWAVKKGVSDGTDPDGPVTREQLVTMLYRYAQNAGMDVSVGGDTNILSYSDALDVAEWAVPAFQWACGSGIISGTGGATLSPRTGATRAQLAAILQRYSGGTV